MNTDPAIVLADAETRERVLADHLLEVSAELLAVQRLPWGSTPFDEAAYAKMSRLIGEKERAYDAWLIAHQATNNARTIWLQHI